MSNVITGEAAAQDEISLWEKEAHTAKAERDALQKEVKLLRLELESEGRRVSGYVEEADAVRLERDTLRRAVETLQGEVNMLRSALAEKTREHTHIQDLLTKAESDRDVARAELSKLREWPCEGEDCQHTFGDVEAHCANHPKPTSGGCWFCLSCWNAAMDKMDMPLEALARAESDRDGLREALKWERVAFDVRLECAEKGRDTAREALAGSEAARAKLVEALTKMVNRFLLGHGQTEVDGCGDCDMAAEMRAALSASPSAVLAERDAKLRATAAQDGWVQAWGVWARALFGGAEPDTGSKSPDQIVAEHDAKVRAAALEEAADHAEDWTCPQCDQDTARDLSSEIRALASTPSETKEPK